MRISSPKFHSGGKIPRKYTCQGEDINPPLEIHDVPSNAKSLVLILDDPDVPTWVREDRMFVHWVVYDISPRLRMIEEKTEPFATYGKNTAGKERYTGPCPPDGEHRYFFKLYAIDIELKRKAGATKEEILKAIEGHVIEQAELMGTYVKG